MDQPIAHVKACDLCGGRAFSTTVELGGPRALRSDRAIVRARLRKLACRTCGLVCDATAQSALEEGYYRDEYRIALADHVFYTAAGPRFRSTILADWIVSSLETSGVPASRLERVLEIGAGGGFVLTAVADRLPHAQCEGFELSGSAAEVARRRRVPMRTGELSSLPDASFDLAYAVAVLEHVPSPTGFIAEIRRLLRPGGHLVLVQPTQDVPSYDVFFVDHLHHFGTAHMAGYAAKGGFTERFATVGYEWMPNFSLHVWTTQAGAPGWRWPGPPAVTTCVQTVHQVTADMQRLDSTLAQLTHQHHRFGVFGLHEVFALARAYSSLEDGAIRCGLDDEPGKPEYAHYPFPVLTPERCAECHVEDILLTMNKVYYAQASERLTRLGMRPHPVLR
jgi:SAM-dependent methyltransferase